MSWQALLAIIADEVGAEACARISRRAGLELQAVKITIGARIPLTAAEAEAAAPGRPQLAAKRLGVHHTTIYRLLKKEREAKKIIR
jgi:hypothetical protein